MPAIKRVDFFMTSKCLGGVSDTEILLTFSSKGLFAFTQSCYSNNLALVETKILNHREGINENLGMLAYALSFILPPSGKSLRAEWGEAVGNKKGDRYIYLGSLDVYTECHCHIPNCLSNKHAHGRDCSYPCVIETFTAVTIFSLNLKKQSAIVNQEFTHHLFPSQRKVQLGLLPWSRRKRVKECLLNLVCTPMDGNVPV